MLGILCFNEHCQKNKITNEIITINDVEFYEIELDLKKKIDDKTSKKHIKKVFKIFKKQNIKQICAHKVFDKFLGEISYHQHNLIWALKQKEIVSILTKNSKNIYIFGEQINKKVTDFLEFSAKTFDNIYVDFGNNTDQVCKLLMKDYGVSAIKFDVKYELNEKIMICFAVPKKVFTDKILINFTEKNIEQKNVFDIECFLHKYSKNTDITAVANYLCIKNKDNAKDVKIKKIITKT